MSSPEIESIPAVPTLNEWMHCSDRSARSGGWCRGTLEAACTPKGSRLKNAQGSETDFQELLPPSMDMSSPDPDPRLHGKRSRKSRVANKSDFLFANGVQMPACNFSFRQMNKKGEDQAVAASPIRLPKTGLDIHVFAVFDGHGGSKTANFCRENLLKELLPRLKQDPLPSEMETEKFQDHLRHIRNVVLDTFLALNRKAINWMLNSGCTASVVLVTGWLITIANVGDSLVGMETATGYSVLSADHRLNENPDEVARLLKMGKVVAQSRRDGQGGPSSAEHPGHGSLRLYPGGLNMARAIGDEICGEDLLPYPHITQLKMPATGGRIILASDGVWDAPIFSVSRFVGTTLRRYNREQAASSILKAAVDPLKDDTTLLVVDVLPPGKSDYLDTMDKPPSTFLPSMFSARCFGRLFRDMVEDRMHNLKIYISDDTMPEGDIAGKAFQPSGDDSRVFSVFNVTAECNDGHGRHGGEIRRPSELPELWVQPSVSNKAKLSHIRTLSFVPSAIPRLHSSVCQAMDGLKAGLSAR